MTRLWAFLAALLALAATPAAAQTTRALIVGIDTYQYSTSNPETRDAGFNDLSGAVRDAVTFKNLLRRAYRIPLDGVRPGDPCPTALVQNSISLYDECAKRAAIVAALDALIAASQPKDTLVFYFAGHGAQYSDDTRFDQSSGYNGTILPYDARRPVDNAGEIKDIELKAIKERALARGIYFLTVFDSCNSGTATRDGAMGVARKAPPLLLRGAQAPAPSAAPPSGPGGGYWVHFGAAQDGQLAIETGPDGARGGVFTRALDEAMTAMPYATFGDIIREVQARVAARGQGSQNPMAEGELKASFGRAPGSGATFEAAVEGRKIMLQAGLLSGVTSGSRFAVFASQADALVPGATPLFTAKVGAAGDFTAELVPERVVPAPPPRLAALELAHDFGELRVTVANRMTAPAERRAVDAALAATRFVSATGEAQVQVAPKAGAAGQAVLLGGDGTALGELGMVGDSGFGERLAGKLRKVLRVQQLLALRSVPSQAGLAFCIDDSIYDPYVEACPKFEVPNTRVVKAGAKAFVSVTQTGAQPRYLYVFGIDPTYGVALVLPRPGTQDSKVAPDRAHRVPDDPVVMKVPGTYRFVTLATDESIDPGALEQKGTRERSGTACSSALEKLLCDAAEGRRDGSTPRVGTWTATVDTVTVE